MVADDGCAVARCLVPKIKCDCVASKSSSMSPSYTALSEEVVVAVADNDEALLKDESFDSPMVPRLVAVEAEGANVAIELNRTFDMSTLSTSECGCGVGESSWRIARKSCIVLVDSIRSLDEHRSAEISSSSSGSSSTREVVIVGIVSRAPEPIRS